MDIIKKANCYADFTDGPCVHILDDRSEFYLVEFFEKLGDSWALVNSCHDIKPFHYYKYARKFRTDWKIQVWGWENEFPIKVYEHIFNENGKNVLLTFCDYSFSVQSSWFKKALEYKQKTGCNLTIQTKFKERLINLFGESSCKFILPGESATSDFYACFEIKKFDIQSRTESWWESDLIYENHSKAYKTWDIPIDWVSIPNDEIIKYILGI
jgi:hypothetical protein